MDQPLRVIEGPYFRDILDQPPAIEQTLAKLRSSPSLESIERHLVEGWYQRVVLTGMGSSYHALHPLHLRLVEAGIPAIMVDSSELLHYQRRLLEERTLLVLVSQSGKSAEIVRLLEATRGRLETLGVTNTEESPLAQDSTAVVLTDAGDEAAVACKSYLAAQVALTWLGTVLVGGNLDGVRRSRGHRADDPDLPGELASSHRRASAPPRGSACGLLRRARAVAGCRGLGRPHHEGSHSPARRRNGQRGLSPRAPGDAGRQSVRAGVRGRGTHPGTQRIAGERHPGGPAGRAHLAAEDADVSAFRLPGVRDLARPVVELLPVEMITLTLAALAGREAGTFGVAGKVTTTE